VAKGFRSVDRDQQFLMPPDMRDWLPADHQVWFFLAAVGELDLSVFRARHRLGGAGREAYDPQMLLTLLIYAYSVGQRSSRQIERLCHTDVAFRLICAQDVPDHSTIARFRAADDAVFIGLFAQVLALCARAGMGRVSTVAIDGTKIAANASKDASHGVDWFREAAAAATAQAAATDAAEDGMFGPDRGDEVPADWVDPNTRDARIRRCLDELAAEQAALDEAQAAAAQKAAQHAERVAQAPVAGRAPGGVDPVAVATARLQRERARRAGEIAAYEAAVAAARAAGTRLPRGRQVRDPDGGKRVKKARAALDRALAHAGETRPAATQPEPTQPGSGKPGSGKPGSGKPGSGKPKVPQRNLTDPDSAILPTQNGWIQAYNAQLAVGADHLILAVGLGNGPYDGTWFVPMMTAAQTAATHLRAARPHRHLDDPAQIGMILVDAGYATEANLTAPGPDRLIACSKAYDLQQKAATQPVTGPPPSTDTATAQMRHRLRTPEAAALYRKRGATVEPVNGHLKDRVGLRRFARRGLRACLAELNLAGAVHNLRRLHHTQWA
jgi:transposase